MTVRITTDSNGRKHITNEPLLHQPAPVQSCYCPNCEAMGKELAALKAQPAPVQEPVKPTAQEMQNAASNLALMREMWGEPNQPAARVNDEGFIVETGLLLSPGTLLYTTPLAAQQEYERGFIDGRQMQAQSSVDKAVNAMSQRQFVGLTDEEYIHITDTVFHQGHGLVAYYLAIEAKLRSKNNG